eukprot:98151-Rhodomonas_salina.2
MSRVRQGLRAMRIGPEEAACVSRGFVWQSECGERYLCWCRFPLRRAGRAGCGGCLARPGTAASRGRRCPPGVLDCAGQLALG